MLVLEFFDEAVGEVRASIRERIMHTIVGNKYVTHVTQRGGDAADGKPKVRETRDERREARDRRKKREMRRQGVNGSELRGAVCEEWKTQGQVTYDVHKRLIRGELTCAANCKIGQSQYTPRPITATQLIHLNESRVCTRTQAVG